MSIEWYGDDFFSRLRQAALIGVTAGVAVVEQEAVRKIVSPPKTGRIYRRRGIEHQASAPGEAPASDTGRLVGTRTVEIDEAEIAGTLVFRTEYAPMLEFGTVRMEPRPFALPSLLDKQDEIVEAITAPMRQLGG